MKKLLKICFGIILASLFIGMTFVKAEFAVTTGTEIYEVNDSEWDYVFGAHSTNGTGFNFEGQKFPVGTQVSVTVTAETNTTVDYTVNVGSKSDTSSYSAFSILGIVFILFYPLLVSSGSSGTWNQTKSDLGPKLFEMFFIDPTIANKLFYDLSNKTHVSTQFTNTEWTFSDIGGSFDNDTDIAVFQWVLNAKYKVVASNTDFSGKYSFVFAYDQTTGEVMGYRIDLDYSGTSEGSLLDIDLLQEVEKLGYNLPAAGLLQNGFIGIELYIVIPAFAIIGLIGAVIKKRKQ